MADLASPVAVDPAVAVYELLPDDSGAAPISDDDAQEAEHQRAFLRQNAHWFCRLRWLVAGFLTTCGLAAWLPVWSPQLALQQLPGWLLTSGVVLLVANAAFQFTLTCWPLDGHPGRLRLHLWCQIVLDLVVLTVVVHSLRGHLIYAPVAYLFHIILACIFFPRWESLAVTIVAAALLGTLVPIEATGILSPPPGLVETVVGTFDQASWTWQLASLLGIWGIIWFLASRLAAELREGRRELAAANRRLEASSVERAAHMLQTTHQLKAPFAAIHANTQLLLNGYVGPLSAAARAVIDKIASRAQLLSQQIQEMLQLANLRSQSQAKPVLAALELRALVQRGVERIEPQASLRGISLNTRLEPVFVRGSDDYLIMLIDNLLNNAVNYSYNGGCVSVACQPGDEQTARLVIRDQGIGIPAEKLPHVFQDYYRTTEATQHNKASTGLGLAIVRLVAQALQAQVRIESLPGWGTRVTLLLPRVSDPAPAE
jgi:signal transduction histidine kinase